MRDSMVMHSITRKARISTRTISRTTTTTTTTPATSAPFAVATTRRHALLSLLFPRNATTIMLMLLPLWLLPSSTAVRAFSSSSLFIVPPSITTTSSRTGAAIIGRRTQTASAAISWKPASSTIVIKIRKRIPLQLSAAATTKDDNINKKQASCSTKFDLTTALLCGGLAFDAYVEPPPDSSRWERGSQGWQVAFVSRAYARQLYRGLVQVQIQRVSGLPADSEQNDANLAERFVSGRGVDACVLVAVVEGRWKEDVQLLEREQYHTGVLDLTGAAHVSRSSTCWSTVTEQAAKKNTKRPLPYYVPPKLFSGGGAQAVWPDTESPIYLYVQDPATARLVWTVVDDARIAALAGIGDAFAVGSTWKRLSELLPQAGRQPERLLRDLKRDIVEEVRRLQQSTKENDVDESALVDQATQTVMQKQQSQTASWEGTLPLTSKPRKRDKKGQMLAAAAAGAAVAGPMGAAAGAVAASFYEGHVSGAIDCKIQYLPIVVPPTEELRKQHHVYGGMPGIDWGKLFVQYLDRNGKISSATTENIPALNEGADESDAAEATAVSTEESPPSPAAQGDFNVGNISDLEHCFFVNHQKTGATCAVYRSLKRKLIIVSFRGTCAPIDLITDASLVQEAWVEGDDIENQLIPKVHVGFRSSMNSIARRLKELILATPAPGDDISDYDMLVTGHSLGGALSTLFTADIGQYGIDAGRALPQLEPSEPWWKAVANIFTGQGGSMDQSALKNQEPPRPKSLKLYNFGSPRVGNVAFADLFDALVGEGFIDQAYRIVNGDDVVARLPRTFNAFVFGNINYDHVGTTVLISQPETTSEGEDTTDQKPILWIEGESDDKKCPVRDGVSLSSPTAQGTLLNDLLSATRDSFTNGGVEVEKEVSWADKVLSAAGKVSERMKQLKASDIASVVGIDREYTERELRIIQSILQGKALTHHLEDEYYAGMGRASGFLARVGEELVELEEEIAA